LRRTERKDNDFVDEEPTERKSCGDAIFRRRGQRPEKRILKHWRGLQGRGGGEFFRQADLSSSKGVSRMRNRKESGGRGDVSRRKKRKVLIFREKDRSAKKRV